MPDCSRAKEIRMTPTGRPSPTAALEALALPRVDHVDLVTVRLPFVAPFGTSVHVWTDKEAMLMRIESGGATAWSECVSDPDPFYAYETNTTARHIIKDFLLPLVEPGMTLGELEARFRRVRGHGMAKATVENALLILVAMQHDIALHALLGSPAKEIMSGLSIGLQETQEALVAAVGRAVAKGYHRVKMKVRKGQDIEWVRAVRDRFPDVPLMVDANGDYSLSDANHLKQFDQFNLMMVEQPLAYSDIIEHASLQRVMKTAICLDESIHSLADAAAAVSIGACRIINVKQGRVGGLLESIRIAHYAAGLGIDVWSGGMDETGIGRAVNIHLQTAEGFTLPGDTSETSNYFDEDIVDEPVVLGDGGCIQIPTGPGIGVQVVPERILKRTIRAERLR
jgi:O-succinylbenzoate synthase